MISKARSRFNLGRLLEARSSDAPVLAWALAVGVLAGVGGGAFRFAISHAEASMEALRGGSPGAALPVSIVAAALSVGLALVLTRRFAPEAAGSGIQEIEGALDGVRPLRWARVLCVKFGAGVLSLGAGMVMGREGPTVQMGGALGQMLRERFGLSDDHGRVLVAAGAGAGLTAAFNAPLAGMLFVIEEMRPHFAYNVISVQCVLIACVAADVVVRALLGDGAAFTIGSFPMPPLHSLTSFAVFGVMVGVAGALFNRSIFGSQDLWAKLGPSQRLVACMSVGGCVGALAVLAPDLTSGGYGAIQDAMSGRIPELGLLLLFAARFA